MKSLLAVAALLTFAPIARAAPSCSGLPSSVTLGDHTLVLNGSGIRTRMGLDWYRAALYLDSTSTDAKSIR